MEKTLEVLNSLVGDRVIEGYVIGGAIAAMFYIDPIETADLDIFILFPRDKLIVSLDDIYSRLRRSGYEQFVGEGILIEGLPVQFLPASTPLLEEAYLNAEEKKVGRVTAKVARLEHLMGIMLSVGRAKDKVRLASCLESPDFDEPRLVELLERYALLEKWRIFKATV